MQQYGRDRIGTRRMTDDAPVAPEGAYSMRARILGSMVSRVCLVYGTISPSLVSF